MADTIIRGFEYSNSDGNWLISLTNSNKIYVSLVSEDNREMREYQLNPIESFIQENEYVFFYMADGSFYQFKFEDSCFFVGDEFDSKEEHVNTFSAHVFFEDVE